MKLHELSLNQARKEFGDRLVTLNTGAAGLRAGIHTTCKDVAGDAPVLDFIGSDGRVDRYNEVIDQKGWQLDNFRANPVIPDCHQYDTVGRILGRALSVEVRDGQLVNRVEFCLDNPLGSMAYKMAKGGFIKSQSVGFIPQEWTSGKNADEPDRTYTQCELLEISLVVVPANPGATIGNQIKSMLSESERRDLADFLKILIGNNGQSGSDQFCSNENTDPDAKGSTSGAEVIDVHRQLLQIARGLHEAIKRA